jgi:hypothetical protein
MRFSGGKNSLCLVGLGLALCGLAGCSRACGSKLFDDFPDYPPNKIAYYYIAIAGAPLQTKELQVGAGRAAQPGRKMKVRVAATDGSGNSYGSGSVAFLDPPFRTDTWGYGVDSGTVPPEFLAAIGGMREGGVRKFTLPAATSTNAVTALSDGESHHTVIQYPHGVEVIFTVTLEKVCKPKFCSTNTLTLLDSGNQMRSRETSCE